MVRKTVATFLALFVIADPSMGRSPRDSDPLLGAWFESLVEARVAAGRHEAFVQGVWPEIPEEKTVPRRDNPTGRAILRWSPDLGMMCSEPGSGV